MSVLACTSSEIPEVALSDMLSNNGFVDISTLSGKQRQSYKNLCLMLISNMKYQDGKVSLTVSKKDITALGFAESLYDKWNKEIADINATLSQDTTFNRILEEKFAKAMENAQAQIAEW